MILPLGGARVKGEFVPRCGVPIPAVRDQDTPFTSRGGNGGSFQDVPLDFYRIAVCNGSHSSKS